MPLTELMASANVENMKLLQFSDSIRENSIIQREFSWDGEKMIKKLSGYHVES